MQMHQCHFIVKNALKLLYSVSSPGSDVGMQTQLLSVCIHSLFLCACEISLGARDLELPFANKRATSLAGDDGTEYSNTRHQSQVNGHQMTLSQHSVTLGCFIHESC